METFFVSLLGYATNLKNYETKDKNERTPYKLTVGQLKFTTKIRRCLDDFRHKSSKFLKKNDGKHLELLKNLASDKSTIITKVEQGRMIVVLDREDYLNKMESLINDHTTFKRIEEDPTIFAEDRLIRKLRQMEKTWFYQ